MDWGDHLASGNVFRCNNIEGNEPYGIESVSAGGEVDAEGNWWGHASGPSGEGRGSGDAVSANVDYTPWLTLPCGTAEPPHADFDAVGQMWMGEAPHTVQFQDLSTGDIYPYPDGWLWSFGDGETSDERSPSHTYQNEGTYDVNLRVTGPGGSDDTHGQVIVPRSLPLEIDPGREFFRAQIPPTAERGADDQLYLFVEFGQKGHSCRPIPNLDGNDIRVLAFFYGILFPHGNNPDNDRQNQGYQDHPQIVNPPSQ